MAPPPLASASAAACGGGEEDADIYVRTIVIGGGSLWFKLNTGTIEENVLISPNIPLPPKPLHASSVAAVGSTIYLIGGSTGFPGSTPEVRYADVYYLDTAALQHGTGWKKAPPMNKERASPYPVPLHDGRLLVIGGTHVGRSVMLPFAEIYDPNTLTWTPCNTIPDFNTIPFCFEGHTILGNKVFLYSGGVTSLCCYDIQEDYWEACNNELRYKLGWSALIDDVLYIVDYASHKSGQFLIGYDLKDFKSLPSSSQTKNENEKKQNPFALSRQMPVYILRDGNKDIDTTELFPQMDEDFAFPVVFLLALGSDKLAMVWNDYYANIGRDKVALSVSVFQMIKMNIRDGKPEDDVLVARPLYQRRYQVQGGMLFDCVAVPQKVEAHEDLPYDNNIDRNCCKMNQLDEEKRVRKKKLKKKKWIRSS